ncbi:MAG: DUF58 domain-containing protein [Roseibacillus sp.]|mgnify:CR=1 FL=1|jgi:uncharacterized protein (DUF58 family)|nr:DUF58 domain-containing protein [Roseibacillus sp.]
MMNENGTAKRAVPFFFRFLHWSYAQGAFLSYFLNRRITPAGWVVLGLLLLSAILGVDISKSSLYQLFALSLAMVAVAFFWAWARRARFSARREMPRHATVGQSCPYIVDVVNEGRLAVRGFVLADRPSDPRPSLRRFAFTEEPGEKERNLFDRTFVYYRWRWLLERRLFFRDGVAREPGVLLRGKRLRVRMSLVPQRRGVIRLADLRVRLPDPFGLFQRCRRVTTGGDSLVVLPKRYRLPTMNLPGEACFQLGGEAVSNTIGQSGEFLGLRDYRSGDALRHIHWKGWAKTARPIVKEFEDVYFPRYGLVLDNFVEHGDEDLFEESVSVAASFASAIDTKRSLLDLMFIKDEAIVVKAGRGEAKAEKLLEVLAAVEAEPDEHFEALERLVRRHRDQLTACICVFTGWSADRARFLRHVVSGGMESLALILCRDLEATERLLKADPVSCRHLLLEPPHVQEGLLKL